MHLLGIDLNLLIPLQALLHEASVQNAAKRIARTPPAVSHALARLREHFDDPLLVRAGQSMVRTPKADELLPLVNKALVHVEAVFSPAETPEPASVERLFRILSTDLAEFLILRPLGTELAELAPGISILSRIGSANVVEALRRDSVDVALAVRFEDRADLCKARAFDDGFVTAMRAEHPLAGKRLTLKRYLGLNHILVAPQGTTGGVVDQILREQGRNRRVTRIVGGFLAGLHLVTDGNQVVTVSRRLANALAPALGLVLKPTPLAIPDYTVWLLWHRRAENDLVHRWFRDRLLATARNGDTEAHWFRA